MHLAKIALNEQFMVAGLDENSPSSSASHHHPKKTSVPADVANLVLKILKDKLGDSKTFGENLIFILNRLSKPCSRITDMAC